MDEKLFAEGLKKLTSPPASERMNCKLPVTVTSPVELVPAGGSLVIATISVRASVAVSVVGPVVVEASATRNRTSSVGVVDSVTLPTPVIVTAEPPKAKTGLVGVTLYMKLA